MEKIQLHYSREIHAQLGYWGTWLPSNQISLGDIGLIQQGIFRKVSTLKDEGIAYEKSLISSETSHEYMSKGALDIRTKVSGDLQLTNSHLKKEDAGFRVEFKQNNAIYFKVDKAKTFQIDNVNTLEKEILARLEKGTWQKDWVIISELVQAKETLVLVGNSKGATIEFKAKGSIEKSVNAHLGVEHQIVFEKNMAYKMINAGKTTPLFKILGVSSSWLGRKKLRPKTVQFDGLRMNKKTANLIELTPFDLD